MKAFAELAKEAGFEAAANNAENDYSLAKKLLVAYASYKIVTQEQMTVFQDALKKRTMKGSYGEAPYEISYKKLALVPIQEYATMPPGDVLVAVAAAKKTALFDTFQVAYITDHVERRDPDPIVFGKIEGCTDYFFVAQWGDDVSISDILASQENADVRVA